VRERNRRKVMEKREKNKKKRKKQKIGENQMNFPRGNGSCYYEGWTG
jgi:hypothetical protein